MHLHNVKVSGETASVDEDASWEFLEALKEIIEEIGYSSQQYSMWMKQVLFEENAVQKLYQQGGDDDTRLQL